jgi:C_GCAxxG_C_C family probable redox protein
MTPTSELALSAMERFQQKYSCSQCVLTAFAPQFDLPDKTALLLAGPFGGGVARTGQICGAVSGALMALSLKYGYATPDGKEKSYAIMREFMQRFKDVHEALECNTLLGHDISTEEGAQAARESGAFARVCPQVVGSAVEIVESMLREDA